MSMLSVLGAVWQRANETRALPKLPGTPRETRGRLLQEVWEQLESLRQRDSDGTEWKMALKIHSSRCYC